MFDYLLIKYPVSLFFTVVLSILISVFPSNAQNKRINFKRYTINEGLSQNTVYALLEDREGIIWIGTEDGLNKFDGYDFTYYKHENRNPHSISHNQVNALYEDKAGKIWIGTSDGLNVFDKKTEAFTRLNTIKNPGLGFNENITSIYEDKKGDIWVTTQKGLIRYHPEGNNFLHFDYPKDKRTDKVMEDDQGMFWVSIDKDLRRFDPKKKQYIPLPASLENNVSLRNSYPRVIKKDAENKIWIGTERAGLFIYDTKENSLQHFRNDKSDNKSLPIDIIRDIHFYNDKEVWIGTRDGLSIFNKDTKQFTNHQHDRYNPASLSQNSIRTIIKDKAGNVWLGTFSGGLNLIAIGNNMFNYLGAKTAYKPGLNYQMVSAVTATKNGGLWVGTEGGGINFVNRDFTSFQSLSLPIIGANIAKNTIKSLVPDGDNLWVGTFDGLSFINGTTKASTNISIPGNIKDVASLLKINDELWIGTNGGGLILRDKNGGTKVFRHLVADSNSLSRNNILKIVADKQNNLWIGTSWGLNYYDRNKFRQFHFNKNNPYSLSNNSIASLLVDRKNRIWVGTKGGGLNLFDKATGRFYVIDETLGLANNVIQAIEEDHKGHLWVSTNSGISRIVIHGALPFTAKSVGITNFFVADGLQSNQFMRNSSFISDKGELYFGGINGLTYFHPDQIKKNQYQPKVILTEFSIRNKPVVHYGDDSPLKQAVNETEEIVLNYDEAFISFRFAALNFVNPAKNKYAYMLDGLNHDDEWHFVGNQRYATYTNLDAGTYIFKVKAANNNDVWNDTPKTIKIIVLPPWWATWWAFSFYLLILGGLFYLYNSYAIKTAKLKSDLSFQHLIHEKDHDLYQRKLNFFTNISHEIKTPLTLILAPLEKLLSLNEGNNRVQHQLMLMKRNGERLVRLINQLLDFRKFESGNMQLQAAEGNIIRFVREVVLAFDSYAQHLNVNLHVEADSKSIRVYFDRDKFEKILYNLLSNALKFTRPEGTIIVRIKEELPDSGQNKFVLIEVEDNGAGISADIVSRIFEQFKHFDEDGANLQGTGIGLAFTKGLVEMHKGEISVESRPETDTVPGRTCFIVKIPLGKDHLKDNELIADYKDSENIDNYFNKEQKGKNSEFLEERKVKVLATMEGSPEMLIVEDNKDVINFLREHFEDKFHIHTAYNGKEGMEKALSVVPDIIISDVMMPLMSGTDLCRMLKTDNRTSHIPIILLTARAPMIYKIEGLETGADDYITKPFNINIVEARVWNLLEQRQHLRERYRKEITLQPQNLAITSPDEVFLHKVMAYVEMHIDNPALNVEDLAAEVFMSRTTLYRKIKALTNQTTVELIRAVRLKRAAQLLETQGYSISEVAYMTGFTEINYFRKCFKEQFNQTPTAYINKIGSPG
ncbi:two-component regulator propeller domain-containing protein [Pedobacter immunditicola]|uniref:two-component regulator propeller domain-containing protein n=1 Tax=Pedobacter immunditicola TaxID=3133440 RepID=UPI003095C772